MNKDIKEAIDKEIKWLNNINFDNNADILHHASALAKQSKRIDTSMESEKQLSVDNTELKTEILELKADKKEWVTDSYDLMNIGRYEQWSIMKPRIEELEKELEKYKPKLSPNCESCPSFQGRDEYCMMGLSIGKTDSRICNDYGLINQKELLIERGCYEEIKKYWKKTAIHYIKKVDVERIIDEIDPSIHFACFRLSTKDWLTIKEEIKQALKEV